MALLARALITAVLLAASLARGAPAAAMDAYWTEPAYASYPAKGPGKAPGLVIWNHGADGHLPPYKGPPIPAIEGFAARGWGVIKLHRNPVSADSWSNARRRPGARA